MSRTPDDAPRSGPAEPSRTGAPGTSPDEGPAAATPAQWAALAVLLLGAFMGFLDIFIVNVANPSIQAELHAGFAEIQLVPTGYTLAYGAGLVTGGRLGDLLGRRRLFLAGLVAFAAASVGCAAAQSPGFLIAARVVQGLAAAVMLPQVLALIQVTFRRESQRARAIGLYGAVIGVGVVAGQIVGGLLIAWDVAGLGWRSVFLVNVPLCLIALVAGVRLIEDDERGNGAAGPRPTLDLPGAALLGLGLLAGIHALVTGAERGWPGVRTAQAVLAVALLGLFALRERRVAAAGAAPLLPPRLFRQRGFALGLPTAASFHGMNGAFVFLLAFHLQKTEGLTALESALTFTPMAILTSVASVLCGRLVARFGRHAVTASAAAMALGLLLVLAGVVLRPDGPATALLPGLLLYGAGGGIVATSLLGTALSGVHPDDVGAASGGILTAIQASEALGVAGIGALFATLSHSDAAYGFARTVLVLAALALLTAALLDLLGRPGRPSAPAGEQHS